MATAPRARGLRRREKELHARKLIDAVSAEVQTANLNKLEDTEDVAQVQTALDKLNKNLKNIKKTDLAKADAEVFLAISQKSAQTIRDAARSSRRIDQGQIIDSLKRKFPGTHGDDTVGWDTIGEVANMFFNGIFDNGFFLNTLDIMPRERKARQKKQKITEAPIERPEKVQNEEGQHKAQEHHEKLQRDIGRIVKKRKNVGFLETVVNPDSFTQTVENIFSSSFLMSADRISLTLDSNGVPRLVHDEENTNGNGQQHKGSNQSILSFNMKDWLEASKVCNIRKPELPTRTGDIYKNTT